MVLSLCFHQKNLTSLAESSELTYIKHALAFNCKVYTGPSCRAKWLFHLCHIVYVLQATLEELTRCPNSNIDFQPITIGSGS